MDLGLSLDPGVSRRVTAVDLVRDSLRRGILRGDLPGGTRLVQTDVAAQLGVSTTPVREAMRDLVAEGLVIMESNKIGTVRRPNWQEMAEIAQVRKALEPTALELAMANISQDELTQARALADSLAGEEDLGSWVEQNTRFHTVFHRATTTVRLVEILKSLEEAGGLFVAQAQRLHPEIRAKAVSDHYSLLEAFEQKDLPRAIEIQLGHVDLPLAAASADQRS